mgnify:CR=1 FL=1
MTCVWMCQNGTNPLMWAAWFGRLSVVEYLLEKGADMEAKDDVSDVILWMWSHSYATHEYIWMYQIGKTPLLLATARDHFPVIEYLVKKGADMEAKNTVSDVISLMWSYTYVTHEHMCVNVSAWKDSVVVGGMAWSLTSGWIPSGERSWYRDKGSCKRCHISDVKPQICDTWIYICEWIRMDTRHWWRL